MTIVGEAVAPIIMGYCGYYGEYGDCLSHTVSMLWGDWRVCTFETLCLPLAKRIFSKAYPSFLTLKEGSTSHPCPLSSGAREETALLGARNRFALRLADHQRSRQVVRDGTAWGKVGDRLGIAL